MEKNCKVAKIPDQSAAKNAQIKATEVTALNREVELLKWQLAQTEANRQMQIALLQQIVSFLTRVKEHMENQSQQQNPRQTSPSQLYTGSFKSTDLPRSRSVLTVNKNTEYGIAKALNTRKISKSISNVNGFTDYHVFLNQSKLSLNQVTDTKITEEISRLITLATTVLSTKLPDLTCTCDNVKAGNESPKQESNIISDNISVTDPTEAQSKNHFNVSLDLIEESFTLITDCEEISELDRTLTDSCPSSSHFMGCFEDDFVDTKMQQSSPIVEKKKDLSTDKTYNVNERANFIEDESGFSSMSSFQEIGIPIINIIPPSPCKSAGFPSSGFDVLNVTDKWDSDTIEIDKHAMKVFWV